MDRNIGAFIEDRYRIDELVGVGGMANVYKATDVTDGKIVAVKMLKQELYGNEEVTRRFINESKAIAVLAHPNIIKVFDVSFSGTEKCIVMEFIDGITLKEYIESQGSLSWKEALYFVTQILKALGHAHKRGIIHRDVKPQNVLMLSNGTLKITDFGIARFARNETRTITDKAIGTVHYISPEQAKGDNTDQRADIYSIGVIFYEMLTGRLPFDADSPVSVAIKQIELEAPLPTAINSQIPQGLEDITLKAMEKNPDHRYQNAEEMLTDIENFKRDPSMHFTTKQSEVRTISTQKNSSKQKQSQNNGSDKKSVEKRRSVIPVLAGITAAVILITGIFVASMFYLNNPFEKVPDVTVPELLGLNYDVIRNSEQYKDFVIEVEEGDFNELYEEGQIYSQNPKSGRTVKINSKIKVKVSSGKKVVVVPNIVGVEETIAYGMLNDADLKYTKSTVFSNTIASGKVVSCEPGVGSQVGLGKEITVFISMGAEDAFIPVPDLKGLTKEAAKKALEAVGLKLGGVSQVPSLELEGTIIAQDPPFGGEISMNSYVNINIASSAQTTGIVDMSILLPKMDKMAKVQAMVDGRVVQQETINPQMAEYWRPSFEGNGIAKIYILIDDFLYHAYELDFTKGSSTLIEDNSSNFTW